MPGHRFQPFPQKLHLDFRCYRSVTVPMGKDTQATIERLTVLAGTIMEDVSVEAVSSFILDADKRRKRIGLLKQAATDIATLLAAAEVVDRHSQEGDE
jgi:hypothetical protein